MRRPSFIEIGGKRYLWKDLLELRKAQIAAWQAAQPKQMQLFDLKVDCRPAPHKTATGRYLEPSLFSE